MNETVNVLIEQLKKVNAENENLKFRLSSVSDSLHYDEKLLIDLWYKRNPCHEHNLNSGEDMFWRTAFMVFEDYVREVLRNDRKHEISAMRNTSHLGK
jgi:hypothetical protein